MKRTRNIKSESIIPLASYTTIIKEVIKFKKFFDPINSALPRRLVGELGEYPYNSIDAFGESINTTFIMNGRPFKARFNISPQLFRKLDKDTRKIFHKFTPPVVYIAE